jgi:hypothetical protein
MSSDKSDSENRTVFVRRPRWRSQQLSTMLEALDTYEVFLRKKETFKRRGNPGYRRVRESEQPFSSSSSFPYYQSTSLYDHAWLKGLSSRDRAALRPIASVTIPVVVSMVFSFDNFLVTFSPAPIFTR